MTLTANKLGSDYLLSHPAIFLKLWFAYMCLLQSFFIFENLPFSSPIIQPTFSRKVVSFFLSSIFIQLFTHLHISTHGSCPPCRTQSPPESETSSLASYQNLRNIPLDMNPPYSGSTTQILDHMAAQEPLQTFCPAFDVQLWDHWLLGFSFVCLE